jgi:AAA+ superfamily predicted ATPase
MINYFFSTLTPSLLFVLCSFLYNNFNLIIGKIYICIDFFENYLHINNEIRFQCIENTSNIFGACNEKNNMITSDCFKSLCFYIKKQINNGNILNLKVLKELNSKIYNEHNDNNNSEQNEVYNTLEEILYFPNQNQKFTILDDEFGIINFKIRMNKCVNEKSIFNIYILSIFSNKLTLNQLQLFIERNVNIYRNYIEEQMIKNKYIFIYQGINKQKELIYSSYPLLTSSTFDNLYFSSKDKILNQINFFKNNKEWYKKRGKPYTLGICCWGVPGCGKTTFEKTLAKYLDRHIINVDFSKIKDQNEADKIFFSEKINNIVIPYEKRIYSFSDIDRMTDILENKDNKKVDLKNQEQNLINKLTEAIDNKNLLDEKGSGCVNNNNNNDEKTPLNLSKILNILDGIPERTGQIIIMTCNNPEKLDKALLRPGRIDILLEFKRMKTKHLIDLLNNFFEKNISLNTLNKNEVEILDEKWTPAEVFKLCSENSSLQECLSFLIEQNSEENIYPFR